MTPVTETARHAVPGRRASSVTHGCVPVDTTVNDTTVNDTVVSDAAVRGIVTRTHHEHAPPSTPVPVRRPAPGAAR